MPRGIGFGRVGILGYEGGLPECPKCSSTSEVGRMRSSAVLEYMVATVNVSEGVRGSLGQQGSREGCGA